jgi:hypothetical protein
MSMHNGMKTIKLIMVIILLAKCIFLEICNAVSVTTYNLMAELDTTAKQHVNYGTLHNERCLSNV